MTSIAKVRSKLRSYIGSERMVKIRRHSRPSYTIDGFVLAVGRKWVLLSGISSGGYFDGYTAIRVRDIERLRRDTSFQSDFAKTRPEWPPTLPTVEGNLDLDSTRGMLRTLPRENQFFGIERNKRFDALWIGIPAEISGRWLYIWEVDHQGRWHDSPLGYKVGTITTVVLDDRYQTALRVMAGDPPADASAEWSPTQPA